MFTQKTDFKAVSFIILAGMWISPLSAGESGVRGATFLKIGAGPRASAMGEAQVAVANDSYASYWNPAGLAQMSQAEVSMTYQRSFQDIDEQSINLGVPVGRRWAFGAYATRVSVEPFASFDASGNTVGEVESSDAAYGLASGYRAGENFYVGGTAKLIRSSLGPAEANSHAFDAGALIKIPLRYKNTPEHSLGLGFAAKNMGPALVYDEDKTRLPLSYVCGLGFETPVAAHRLTAALDYNFSPDHRSYYTFGQELWIHRVLAIRVGYRFGQEEEAGIRAGMSIAVRGIRMSYSISPFGFLGEAHRFGFSYQFAAPVLKVKTPKKEPLKNMAPKSEQGEPKPASLATEVSTTSIVVPMQKEEPVKPILPKKKQTAPIVPRIEQFKKAPIDSPVAAPAVIPKQQLPNDIPSLLELGNQNLKDGRFDEAVAVFGKTLKIDPNNKTALELMRRALSELERQKKRKQGIYE